MTYEISDERARELFCDERELRFILETTPEIRFKLVRSLLVDRFHMLAEIETARGVR